MKWPRCGRAIGSLRASQQGVRLGLIDLREAQENRAGLKDLWAGLAASRGTDTGEAHPDR